MSILKKAEFKLALSMVIFGTLAPFVRNISVSSGEIALYRAMFASVLILVYIIFSKQKIPSAKIKKDIPLLLASGAFMGINWILLFEAYKYTTVSLATLSYYFAPVLVTLACPLLFREKMSLKNWVCFIASTIGLIMITGIGDISQSSSHITGILFGLGAAVFYASVILINKFIKSTQGLYRTFLQFLAAVIVLIPYVLFTSGINLSSLNSVGITSLLIVGLVHTGIAYVLYFSSLKELPGQKTAILSYIDPLCAVLISVFILGEEIKTLQIIGGILILGFTLLNEIKIENKNIQKNE